MQTLINLTGKFIAESSVHFTLFYFIYLLRNIFLNLPYTRLLLDWYPRYKKRLILALLRSILTHILIKKLANISDIVHFNELCIHGLIFLK